MGRVSLRALTGARFLAALWVVVYHYDASFRFTSHRANQQAYVYGPHTPLDMLILQGHLAVDFFFLLSGFILAYTYLTDAGTTKGGARAFWVARIARIYPVYLLGLLLALWPYIAQGASKRSTVAATIAHVLMLHGWLPATQGLNQPSWSLSVEAFFYALFPLVLPLVARRNRRGLWAIFVGSWVVFVLILFGLQVLGSNVGLASLSGWRSLARYTPLISLPLFVAGTALGVLFVREGARAFPLLPRLSRLGFDLCLVGTAGALAAVLVLLFSHGVRSNNIDFAAGATMPLLAALIVLLAFQRGIIAALLAQPVVVWLGEISYGIYILHSPLWKLLYMFASATFNPAPSSPLLALAFAVLVIGVAGASFQFLETPLRRAIRARWGRPKVTPVPVTTEASPVRA